MGSVSQDIVTDFTCAISLVTYFEHEFFVLASIACLRPSCRGKP